MIKVVFFQRKPISTHKSIEFIFEDVRERLAGKIRGVKKIFSFESKGILNRLYIMFEAYFNQGDVNHITGDIHFATLLLPKKKTILTIHDCGILATTSGVRHLILKLFWFKLPLKKCRFVTVVSQSTKAELLKYTTYPESNICIIPVGVSKEFRYCPKEFNIQKPIILQFCTTPNKNVDRVIEAISSIPCKLILIGNLEEATIERMNKRGICYENFNNTSWEFLIDLYKRCDMLSFVSTYEGFGMPIIEAQITGRPVITSNITSMPEIAGNGACIVDPYNISSIRKGFLEVINNDNYRRTLIQNGLENCKRFNPDIIADEYLRLYKRIITEK